MQVRDSHHRTEPSPLPGREGPSLTDPHLGSPRAARGWPGHRAASSFLPVSTSSGSPCPPSPAGNRGTGRLQPPWAEGLCMPLLWLQEGHGCCKLHVVSGVYASLFFSRSLKKCTTLLSSQAMQNKSQSECGHWALLTPRPQGYRRSCGTSFSTSPSLNLLLILHSPAPMPPPTRGLPSIPAPNVCTSELPSGQAGLQGTAPALGVLSVGLSL